MAARKTIGQKRDERKALIAKAPKQKTLTPMDRLVSSLNTRLGGIGRVFRGSDIEQQVYERRSSGVPSIDYVTNGGYPRGGLVEIGGEYSVGKTRVAIEACAHEQRTNAGAVGWVALEPFSKKWARECGFFIPFSEKEVADPNTGELKPMDPFAEASALELFRMEQAGIEDPYTQVSEFILIQEERGDVALDASLDMLRSNQFAIIVVDSLGVAKCLGLGTDVLMHDGRRVPVEEIVVGDFVMGPDSQPRKVLSTTRGTGPLYRVDPTKGDSWVCNDAHVLTLVHSLTNEFTDISVSDYQALPAWQAAYLKQTLVGVDFPNNVRLPVDPYFTGLWYGDGTKDLASVQLTNMDPEVLAFVETFAAKQKLSVSSLSKPDSRALRLTLSAGKDAVRWTAKGPVGRNRLLKRMRRLYGTGDSLPFAYLTASRNSRLRFLAGLIDTDGTYGNGCFSITQKRERWAHDIAFLARSLGYRASVSLNRVAIADYWRVCISGNIAEVPVRIARKQPPVRVQKKRAERTGVSLSPIGVGPYAGFTLDGDGRFLLGDFTVTHNSTKWLEENEVQDAGDFPREAKMIGDYTTRAVLALNARYDENNVKAKDGKHHLQTTLIHLNHIGTEIGSQAKAKHKTQRIKGGEGNKHNHHFILFLWKGELKGVYEKNKPNYIYAQEVQCIGLKSKLGPDQLAGAFDFYKQPFGDHQQGDIDTESDAINLALFAGVIRQNGAHYEYGAIKGHGIEAFKLALKKHPEVLEEIKTITTTTLRR